MSSIAEAKSLTQIVLKEQRDKTLKLAEKHGARNVRVFGSVVRGEETADSDIDFLVDLGETLTPWFPTGIIHDLESLLGCKVDVVTEKSLHYYICDKVLEVDGVTEKSEVANPKPFAVVH